MLLMIDNYDSFTYNLVQYFGELGEQVKVIRNDQCNIVDIERLNPQRIVISPGPGDAHQAGISLEVIQAFQQKLPIFGVCLGMQVICTAFGGKVVQAKRVMHGKLSAVKNSGKGVFTNLPESIQCTRYHSLVAEQQSLPDSLEITAWTESDDGGVEDIMALSHRHYNIQGVQFHPESIASDYGKEILQNFLQS